MRLRFVRFAVDVEELRQHLLGLADQKEIEQIRDRFGVQEDRRAARDQQRGPPQSALTLNDAFDFLGRVDVILG